MAYLTGIELLDLSPEGRLLSQCLFAKFHTPFHLLSGRFATRLITLPGRVKTIRAARSEAGKIINVVAKTDPIASQLLMGAIKARAVDRWSATVHKDFYLSADLKNWGSREPLHECSPSGFFTYFLLEQVQRESWRQWRRTR